jgi:hypothetical protein
MNITVRSSDLGELTKNSELIPVEGTATVVSGTGAFIAPISMLRELVKHRMRFDDLRISLKP